MPLDFSVIWLATVTIPRATFVHSNTVYFAYSFPFVKNLKQLSIIIIINFMEHLQCYRPQHLATIVSDDYQTQGTPIKILKSNPYLFFVGNDEWHFLVSRETDFFLPYRAHLHDGVVYSIIIKKSPDFSTKWAVLVLI